ncbi:MAG TPA: hypothetical protein VFG32_01885 [Bacteroidota bacterium]|nr:hypothetical protein [Bacteroidota bacterium]
MPHRANAIIDNQQSVGEAWSYPATGGRFTEEELDFPPKDESWRTGIPPKGEARRTGNYDIKYRMGKELAEE